MKQNKMYLIGLTGGIATGKSTVSAVLKSVGINVIDADKVSKEILEPNHEGWYEVIAEFGNDFVNKDYTINRKKLADYVFQKKEYVDKLNSLLHPIIIRKINAQIDNLQKSNVKLAFLDAPLLFETNQDKICNETWLLVCGVDEQIRRVMERDGKTYEQAVEIIENQMPDSVKTQRATKTIDTSSSIESTIRYIKNLLEEIIDEIG